MTPNEYQTQSLRTECEQEIARRRILESGAGTAIRLLHSLIGAMGELGELAALVENHLWYGKPVLSQDRLRDEFGDLLWYISQGITAAGLQLEDVLSANLRKLKARYPSRYEDYLADRENRDRIAEATALLPPSPPLRRSVDEVLAARIAGGCCPTFSRQQSCKCLEEARKYA